MKIENIDIKKIIPYERNPRRNDQAVDIVAKSVREFGFRVPVIIDKDNVIIAGHTRLKAAEKLGITEIPCVRADNLTPEQAKAFRIMDNKSHEYSMWDFDKLLDEIDQLRAANFDTTLTGFNDADLENINKSLKGNIDEISEESLGIKNECPKCGYEW